MMMFAMAAALLISGGALGTPWLTGLFGDDNQVSSAAEAGMVCPDTLVGLTLISDGDGSQIFTNGDLFGIECKFALAPSTTVSAKVSVTWTENGPNEILELGCGLTPTTVPGVFTAEGNQYSNVGQARADYSGERRYATAMQSLASKLVSAAASAAEPCPDRVIVTIPGDPGSSSQNGSGSVSQPSVDGSGSGAGTSGSGDGGSQPGAQSSGADAGNASAGNGGSPAGTPVPGTSPGTSPGTGLGNFGTGGQDTVTAAQVPVGSCIVQGRVTDSRGIAVPLVRLTVHDAAGALVATTATGQTGMYGFSQPVVTGGSVVLTPTDGGRGQEVFQIFAQQAPATLARQLSRVTPEGGLCSVNFDLWNLDENYTAVDSNLEKWPAIIELYQNFNRAAELAAQLDAPLAYGLPVPVYAWCDSTTLFCDPAGVAEFAFYSGSTTGRSVTQPYIALGFPSSELGYRGTPDNREYHEFGHAFFADVGNDEIPVEAGDLNHGGYYRNQKTTDSLIEGFAEFYSVMVSKHVDGVANPHRYKIGAEYDIEADRKPWEAVGWWEEFTLAGLLLDFEDGSADYGRVVDGLDVESVSALNADGGNFAIGRVRNLGGAVAHSPEVTVQLLDGSQNVVFTQVTAVKPEWLGPGQTGVFYVAAPEGVEFTNVEASPGRPAGEDDDEIDLELSDLMRVITSGWGASSDRITTVEELYRALSDAFVGKDVNNDGLIDATQAQVDEIFIRHGFFDDIDGDRQYNPASDGRPGGTAHPAAFISGQEFPAIMPRSSAVGFEGSFVAIDTSGVDADLLVQVELSGGAESYAYWTASGTMDPVELAVPAAGGEPAAVTVIAVAEGRNPTVAYRTSAEQFHAAVESGEIRSEPVRSTVKLESGDPFALLGSPLDGGQAGGGAGGGGGGNGMPPWTMLLPIVLAGVMLGGGIYIMRRTPNPATGSRSRKS